jgi:hypothetical protein
MSEKNIYQKLLAVRKTVEYLKKEATGHKYNYTKESQIIGALRPAMDDEGLFLEVEMLPITWGMDGSVPVVSIQFTWVNCDKPEDKVSKVLHFPCANASDPKVLGGIMTYSVRYFLCKNFQIATDEIDLDAFQQKELATSTTRKPVLDPSEVDNIYDAIGEDKALLKVITDNCPQGKIENLTSDRYPKTMAFIESYKAKKVAQ